MTETARANAAAARMLVDGLVGAGLAAVVASPGARSTPLLLAFAARAAGRLDASNGPDTAPPDGGTPVCTAETALHMVLDERVAGFVALGIARATGRPVALLCSSGSAGAHYLPAVIEAAESCLPLLVLTANRPTELHACGAPQTTWQGDLYSGHARGRFLLDAPAPGADPGPLRALAARAAWLSRWPVAGPVHIDAPFREPLWHADAEAVFSAPPGRAGPSTTPPLLGVDPAGIARVADRLRTARGVVSVGPLPPGDPARDRLAEALARLARRLGWPVVLDPLSQLRAHPALSTVACVAADAWCRDAALRGLLRPDVALHIGRTPTSKHVGALLSDAPGGVTLVDAFGRWNDATASAVELLVGAPHTVVEALGAALATTQTRTVGAVQSDRSPTAAAGATGSAQRLADGDPSHPAGDWLARWLQVDQAAASALQAREPGDAAWSGHAVGALLDALEAGRAGRWLHVASSMAIRLVDLCGGHRAAQARLSANRGVNGIDGTVSTAVGLALGAGEDAQAPVVALVGDLALLHDAGGLLAAGALLAERPAPGDAHDVPGPSSRPGDGAGLAATGADAPHRGLLVVVLDDAGGAIFGHLPVAERGLEVERLFHTPQAADIAALSAAAGARYLRCGPQEMGPGVRALLSQRGLRVLHVPISRTDDLLAFRRRVQAAISAARDAAGVARSPEAPL